MRKVKYTGKRDLLQMNFILKGGKGLLHIIKKKNEHHVLYLVHLRGDGDLLTAGVLNAAGELRDTVTVHNVAPLVVVTT